MFVRFGNPEKITIMQPGVAKAIRLLQLGHELAFMVNPAETAVTLACWQKTSIGKRGRFVSRARN
jgi:hypothetical protein